jgi:hypothetical protein
MPNRKVRVHHTVLLGLLLLSALAIQGCLGMVWLGAVGIDSTRTSDIEFQAFENSWVVAPHERQRLGLVQSIAVMPFGGDPVMAERWAAVFRDMSDLRVLSPSDTVRHGVFDHGQIGLAQRTSAESQVDCVLIGNVAGQEPMKSFVGLKERSSQRLYLYLMSDSGALLWKTELPYTIVKGAKDLDEAMVTRALLTHVGAHANELGLTELETRSQHAASRSSREELDHYRAQSIPELERP